MIVQDFLDNDMYKFTMAKFIHEYYPNVKVRYKLTNRGENFYIEKTKLGAELYNLHLLRPTEEEIEYLSNIETSSFFAPTPQKVFSEKFLNFLRNFSTDELMIYTYRTHNGQIIVEVEGPWCVAVFYEVPILAIISELRSKYFEESINKSTSDRVDESKLVNFINKVNKNRSLRFSDFGTRRRKSFYHQWKVLSYLKRYLNPYHLSGTSNLHFAKKYDIRPVGTFAHELPMVISGLCPSPEMAYPILMNQWKKMFGNNLNILLPDTFTSDWLFANHGEEVVKWEGVRHDSGDPYEFVEKYIKLLKSFEIDPMSRVIVFSDGLDISKMESILEYCRGRVWATFGIGTNLTHNTFIKPPNIVMKAESIVYEDTDEKINLVKLSDDLNKITGDPFVVQKYKEIFKG